MDVRFPRVTMPVDIAPSDDVRRVLCRVVVKQANLKRNGRLSTEIEAHCE